MTKLRRKQTFLDSSLLAFGKKKPGPTHSALGEHSGLNWMTCVHSVTRLPRVPRGKSESTDKGIEFSGASPATLPVTLYSLHSIALSKVRCLENQSGFFTCDLRPQWKPCQERLDRLLVTHEHSELFRLLWVLLSMGSLHGYSRKCNRSSSFIIHFFHRLYGWYLQILHNFDIFLSLCILVWLYDETFNVWKYSF